MERLTTDTALDLMAAVHRTEHVADFGVRALSFIWRWATCSLHGQIVDEVEVSSGVALAEAMIRCKACHDQFGITKKCVVEAIGPVEKE